MFVALLFWRSSILLPGGNHLGREVIHGRVAGTYHGINIMDFAGEQKWLTTSTLYINAQACDTLATLTSPVAGGNHHRLVTVLRFDAPAVT